MSRTLRFALPVVALFCATVLLAAKSMAGESDAVESGAVERLPEESVTVVLLDGRTVSGAVDLKTDAQYLWLRRTAEQLDLVSGYPWNGVLEGHLRDRTLDHSELRAWASLQRQAGRTFAEIAPGLPSDLRLISAASLPVPVSAVKTLVVDAELAQWDKDTQTDGLRVFVYPLDAEGNLVPVDGHVELTLVAEREYARAAPGIVKVPDFVEGDRLTFPVRRAHFTAGPAVYQLPFDRWHPDWELTVAHQALLHARLSVPGRGVFEASDAQVCLRQFSRFRDQLQYYTPGRYLPLENPSRDGR